MVFFFISYSKSVQVQSILTHLQKEKKSAVTVAIRCSSLTVPPLVREKGDFNPFCCHGDNPWRVPCRLTGFPLSYDSLLLDEGWEGSDFGEKDIF